MSIPIESIFPLKLFLFLFNLVAVGSPSFSDRFVDRDFQPMRGFVSLGRMTAKEMADCQMPEAMDADKDGLLLVDEMIEFDKRMASAPKRKYEATSPYVEGGETGMDFIRVLDGDGDGKVTHTEWEKNKQSTVYIDKHWPEYNKNMDEYLTVDEAPQKP